MTGQCVTPVISSQYLEFVGSVPSVPTMTCVQSATIVTNIICDIGFFGLTHQEVKGIQEVLWVSLNFSSLCYI